MSHLTNARLSLLAASIVALVIAIVAAAAVADFVSAQAAIGEHVTNWAGFRRP